MNELTPNVLHQLINYNGRAYFASQYFHHMYRNENGGEKYTELKTFNRLVRSLETYGDYVERGDIVELVYGEEISGTDLVPLMKSNSYQPIMLISATAQIALTHHLDDAISKRASVNPKRPGVWEERDA